MATGYDTVELLLELAEHLKAASRVMDGIGEGACAAFDRECLKLMYLGDIDLLHLTDDVDEAVSIIVGGDHEMAAKRPE